MVRVSGPRSQQQQQPFTRQCTRARPGAATEYSPVTLVTLAARVTPGSGHGGHSGQEVTPASASCLVPAE